MNFCWVFFKKGDLLTKNYLKNSNNIFAENLPGKKKKNIQTCYSWGRTVQCIKYEMRKHNYVCFNSLNVAIISKPVN